MLGSEYKNSFVVELVADVDGDGTAIPLIRVAPVAGERGPEDAM